LGATAALPTTGVNSKNMICRYDRVSPAEGP
jgi:hypothetical protein